MFVFFFVGVVCKFVELFLLFEFFDFFDFFCFAVICVLFFLFWLLFIFVRNLFCFFLEKFEKFDGNLKYRYDILMQFQMYLNSLKFLIEWVVFFFGENGFEIIKEYF